MSQLKENLLRVRANIETAALKSGRTSKDITLVAVFLGSFTHIPAVRHAFAGVRVAVCAVILKAIITLWKSSVKDITAGCVFAAVFLSALLLGVHPAILAVAAGAFGVIFGRLRVRGAK